MKSRDSRGQAGRPVLRYQGLRYAAGQLVEREDLVDRRVGHDARHQRGVHGVSGPLGDDAAHCDGAAGPEVSCDCMFVMARTISLAPTAQPMRKPVMAYIFDTQLITTSLLLSIRRPSVKR